MKITKIEMKHQHNLSNKPVAEWTHTNLLADAELMLAEQVELGYITVEKFESEMKRYAAEILSK